MDKRLTKILALLAQAEKTNHPAEAKTYSAKAQELMTAWQIDEAQLAAAAAERGEQVREIPCNEKIWLQGTLYKFAMIELWDAALRANDVKLLMTKGTRYYENWKKEGYTSPYVRGTWLHLFGFEHNIQMAKMLVASLTIQMENEFRSDAVQETVRMETESAPGVVKWKNGFIFGFARAIDYRLIMAKRRATQESGPGTELVLVRRNELVEKLVSDTFPKIGTADSSSAGLGDNSGRSLGYQAGKRADVGQTRVGSSSGRQALS